MARAGTPYRLQGRRLACGEPVGPPRPFAPHTAHLGRSKTAPLPCPALIPRDSDETEQARAPALDGRSVLCGGTRLACRCRRRPAAGACKQMCTCGSVIAGRDACLHALAWFTGRKYCFRGKPPLRNFRTSMFDVECSVFYVHSTSLVTARRMRCSRRWSRRPSGLRVQP